MSIQLTCAATVKLDVNPYPTPPQTALSAQRIGPDFNLIKAHLNFVYINTKNDKNCTEIMPLYEEHTT